MTPSHPVSSTTPQLNHHPTKKLSHASARASALRDHIFSLPADEFRDKPWKLVGAIEDFARTNELPMTIQASKVGVIRGAMAAMDPTPRLVLEFGTFVGSSALAWGATLRDFHGDAGGGDGGLRVFTFEADQQVARIARDLVELARLEELVLVLDGKGSASVRQLHDEGLVGEGKVDMVFLDHWEECYLPDLRLCEELKLFHKGSVVIADNTDFPGAPAYVDYVKKGGSGESGAVRYQSQSVDASDTN